MEKIQQAALAATSLRCQVEIAAVNELPLEAEDGLFPNDSIQ